MDIEKLDFVYIIKQGDLGNDLRYSLRSIAKYYPNNRVWIVGYKPAWVTNVEYLPVEQKQDKWKNSVNNIIAACKCEDISDDFILMNDDFFAIKPTMKLEDLINCNVGDLDRAVNRFKKKTGGWFKGFAHLNNLLTKMEVKKPYYNFESHTPFLINKKRYLEIMNMPEVQSFMKTSNVLHKRSLYKNIVKPENSIRIPSDVKVLETKDISVQRMTVCGWLSTADGLIGNSKFYNLNRLLQSNLGATCIYECNYKPVEHVSKKFTNLPYKTNKYF